MERDFPITAGPESAPKVVGVMICSIHVERAFSDDNFFNDLPEFSKIRENIDLECLRKGNAGGCHSCSSRREAARVELEFSEIASTLGQDRLRILRKYIGTSDSVDLYAKIRGEDGRSLVRKKIYEAPKSSMESETSVKERANMTNSTVSSRKKPGVMLGGFHITKAVSDASFFKLMPEFASIKAQIDTMHIDVKSKRGCNSCNKRRLHANIDGNFAAIASRLPDARAKVLKKYLGIDDDQPFFIRAMNPADRKLILRQF